jgi:C4-dicarboxylate-specific signal transduction histidine kinase
MALFLIWQGTFNAVSEPVCMINSNYEIIQSNKALLLKTGLKQEQVINAKCHFVLFGKTTPCTGCQRGKNFRVEGSKGKNQTFEVYSQDLYLDSLKEKIYIHQYQEITDQLRLERKIMESAKLAELGTIGSSIAHELNNPLGGILSFVQLIKMDLKPENAIYSDVVEMEMGVLRCRDIIQNLLGFTRKASEEQLSDLDLKDVLENSLRIIELQTRSRGVEVKLQWPESKTKIHGSKSLLVQAFQNLLQKSLDSIEAKSNLNKGFHGIIEVRISISDQAIEIIILDNGLGLEAATGLWNVHHKLSLI